MTDAQQNQRDAVALQIESLNADDLVKAFDGLGLEVECQHILALELIDSMNGDIAEVEQGNPNETTIEDVLAVYSAHTEEKTQSGVTKQ